MPCGCGECLKSRPDRAALSNKAKSLSNKLLFLLTNIVICTFSMNNEYFKVLAGEW